MMCFRDMTFCEFFEDCANAKDCHRPLTQEVKDAAARWWKSKDAPIATFVSKPECHEEKKDGRE
jgi:hypothetical protein